MTVLLLKIFLAPVIITVCTLTGRRYGHSIGGIIVGLPLTSGPVALILALQHGESSVAEYSHGILFGIVFTAVFALVYAHASKIFHWTICALSGWIIYCTAAYFIRPFDFPLFYSFALVIPFLYLTIKFFPGYKVDARSVKAPRWDLPLRICVATGMIFLITYLSFHIEANLLGIVSTFPVYSTIFGAFTHIHYGSDATIRMLKGILIGTFSFALFFLIVGTTIESFGIAFSFLIAISAALLLPFIIFMLSRNNTAWS